MSPKKTHKQNIRELFKHNNKSPPRLDCETRWGSTFSMLESTLLVRVLLGSISLANKSLLLSDVNWFGVQELIECLKLVYGTTTERKSVNNAPLALAMPHPM